MSWKRIESWVHQHEAIIVILVMVTCLRIPTLFEPYWYGDEGIYLTIGQAIGAGRELYQQIHDNKPPLLYWVATLAGGSQFWFKLLAGAWNIVTVSIFWSLASGWWKNKKAAVITTVVFALLTTLPLLEGNIANAELFFLANTVLAFLLLYRAKTASQVFVGGLVLGLGGLFKIPALIDMAVWPVFWLATKDKKWFTKSAVLGVGTLLPFAASIAHYASRGSLSPYLIAAGLQNVPYLSSWQAVGGIMGSLLGRAVITAALLLGLLAIRRRLEPHVILVVAWGIVTLFASLLSGRPYPHYLLQMAPAMALGVGLLLLTKKRAEQAVILGVFGLLMVSFLTFKFYLYPVFGYYQNFLSWTVGHKDKPAYYQWFNPAVDRNYRIAQTVLAGSEPQDEIFIWGDEPMIYALTKRLPTGRYTAAYHIKDFAAQAETIDQLRSRSPRYIVTFGNTHDLAGLDLVLDDKYLLEKGIAEAQVYRRLGFE